ncbi:ML domain-containing protein [Streptomyces sp. MZ04]|uniref:ML domain-containing protein n=1 Tax=Streptomyces sp. MZ04 TaxID=2559236 RepID=UPI00107E9780|nr:ML domain-containing protein [Streptomyces sp. MZ04]TGB10002.1 hypothetical protein E2651_15360 [Streptomyces sp. MZ04]
MTSWSYEDAGRPTDPLQIRSLSPTPEEPKPGSQWKVAIKAEAEETIGSGAYFDLTCKLGMVKLLRKRYDLFACLRGEYPEIPLTLDAGAPEGSIDKGSVEMTLALDLPREVPQAKFKIEAIGYTADDDDLCHLVIDVDFGPTS